MTWTSGCHARRRNRGIYSFSQGEQERSWLRPEQFTLHQKLTGRTEKVPSFLPHCLGWLLFTTSHRHTTTAPMGTWDGGLSLPLDNWTPGADVVVWLEGESVLVRADVWERPVCLQHHLLDKSAEKEEFLPPEIYDGGMRLCKREVTDEEEDRCLCWPLPLLLERMTGCIFSLLFSHFVSALI